MVSAGADVEDGIEGGGLTGRGQHGGGAALQRGDLGRNGSTAFYGSVGQKYEGYGTRLEPGSYRLTMKLTDRIGGAHYLAAEFDVA